LFKFSDARSFGRSLTGICLIGAPVLFLVASIIAPDTDHKNKLRELNAVAAHKGTYLVSGLLYLLAGIVLIVAAIGLVRLFRGPRGVTLGQISGALLVLGGAVSFSWYALGAAEYEMVNHTGLDRTALATYLHKADNVGSLAPVFVLFLIGVVLGTILLAIATRRVRIVPIWASVAIAAAGIVGFFGNGGPFPFVLLLIGLGTLGWRTLAMSDEEWEAPRERSAPPAPATTPEPAPASAS
jgi:drug/metabolite transporter (DMT)-like permease